MRPIKRHHSRIACNVVLSGNTITCQSHSDWQVPLSVTVEYGAIDEIARFHLEGHDLPRKDLDGDGSLVG